MKIITAPNKYIPSSDDITCFLATPQDHAHDIIMAYTWGVEDL